jgi:hypothetical protein
MNHTLFTSCKAFSHLVSILLVISSLALTKVYAQSFSGNELFASATTEQGLGEQSLPLLLAQVSADTVATSSWDSALPSTDQFDWVQTTSGEWLKGEMKVLYSDKLEFDSDEFDLQTLDWEDVKQFLGHGIKRVSIESSTGPRILDGMITVSEDKLIVISDTGTDEFDRSQLISITPGATTEVDNWTAKVSLGLNFTRGNTEQTDYVVKFDIRRRTPENRLVFDYLGNYSQTGNIETINNHRFNTFFDIFSTRRNFWRPVFYEYYRDPFQNIDNRNTIGVAAGYAIIDTAKVTWDISGGPGYRKTRYVSVQAGESDSVDTPVLVGSTYYDTYVNKSIDFEARYNLSIVNQDSGSYTHHAVGTFEIEMTSILDFDISLIWDRTRDPKARADGTVPKQDDVQLMFTLGVDI